MASRLSEMAMCVWHTSSILEVVAVRSRTSSFLTSSLSFRALTNLYWTFHSFSSSVRKLHQSTRAWRESTSSSGDSRLDAKHLPVDISCSVVILHGPSWMTSSLGIIGHSFSSWQPQHQNQLASIYQTSCSQHCPKS